MKTPRKEILKIINQLRLLVDRKENLMFIGYHVNEYLNLLSKKLAPVTDIFEQHEKDDYNNHERLEYLRLRLLDEHALFWDDVMTYYAFYDSERMLLPIQKEYPKLLGHLNHPKDYYVHY